MTVAFGSLDSFGPWIMSKCIELNKYKDKIKNLHSKFTTILDPVHIPYNLCPWSLGKVDKSTLYERYNTSVQRRDCIKLFILFNHGGVIPCSWVIVYPW